MFKILARVIPILLLLSSGSLLLTLMLGKQTATHTLAVWHNEIHNTNEMRLLNLDRGLSLVLDDMEIVQPQVPGYYSLIVGSTAHAWSPSRRQIAVIKSNRIYIMSLDAETTEVWESDLALGAASVDWSPDEKYLVFLANGGVYSVNVHTGDVDAVSLAGEGVFLMAWSLQENCLAYVERGSPSDYKLHLVHIGDGIGCAANFTLPVDAYSLDWSPDGRWIAILSYQNGPQDLYTVDLSTQTLYHVIDRANFARVQVAHWSPNSQRLLVEVDERTGAIYLVDPDGHEVRLLADNGTAPQWSPQGTYITYQSTEIVASAVVFKLHVVNSHTGDPITATIDGKCEGLLWSSDETVVVFYQHFSRSYRSRLAFLSLIDGNIRYLSAGERIMDAYFVH